MKPVALKRGMRLPEFPLLPRSYAVALLVAFGIVIAPIAVALWHAVTQFEQLAKRGEVSVRRAGEAGEQSRVLRDALLGMERAARQASVIGTGEIVDTYARQRERLLAAAERVAAIDTSRPPDEALGAIRTAERAVFEPLSAGRNAEALDALPGLQSQVDALIEAADASLKREREAIAARPRTVLGDLASMAVLAVPFAFVLAGLFAWALWRPVRTVVREIRRLGEGDWDAPVSVPGQTEIAQIGPQLDWLRRRLLELETTRTRLLQQVSHDLKTPLAAITEGRALLNDELYGPVNERQRAVLSLIERNASRLLAQIDALIRDARGDAMREDSPSRVRVDLHALVQRVLDDHRLALDAKRLTVDPTLAHAVVEGQPEQLRMIVDNLISNAVKFSPDGSVIDVRLSRSGDAVALEIADAGPGLAPGEEERIFERGARGSAARATGAPGSGMGLAIARDLAHGHGGEIVAGRREGAAANERGGARFVLTLPSAGERHAR